MKIFKSFIFFVIFSTYLFPQSSGEETANFVELFLGFSNCPQPNSYTFYLDKVSTVWAANNNFNPPGFFINEDPGIDNSIYPWYIQNSIVAGDWKGWNMVYSQDQYTINDTTTPVYGYGLYKISTNASNSHFYIDYRDNRIPYFSVTYIGHAVDHWVKYDFSNNKFYISPISYTSSYTEISNGDLIRFWELKETNPAIPSTFEFPDYWENALATTNTGSNKPRIVWGPYDDDNYTTSGYYVYSATNYSFTPPPLNQFSLVATLNSTTYNWTDNSYVIGGVLKAHYYVKAIITPVEGGASSTSSPTNIVTSTVSSTGGGVGHKDNIKNPELITIYSLSQNYPNPFNPSTIINYQTPVDNFVTLKVFDVLGREVAQLVNTYKEAGTHSVEFNASDLSSGLYFYTLRANGYSLTKKMIITK